MPIPRLRHYQGPAILSYGFRPFFLLGALFAALSILLWLPAFYGELELTITFSLVDWHIHELYFGFLPAIITGFLFTAVPNWTGRMPIQGMPLLFLVIVWLSGRVAISFSAFIGWQMAMLIDVSFLASVAIVIAREIIAGKNWKNLKVLVPLIVLSLANVLFHLEAHHYGLSDISRRLALFAIVTLIILIGGRVIPSFTRNWLARENPGRLPQQFDKLDMTAIVLAVAAMALWCVFPEHWASALLLGLASIAQILRLSRWAGYRTLHAPLVLVLHISYLFIPVGFALLALSIAAPDQVSKIAGIHALSVGAMGGMTLSMMVRASLGHTGQATEVSTLSKLLLIAVFVAALARIAAAIYLADLDVLLHIAAFGWLIAFAGFSISFAPALCKPRAN